MAIDGVKIIDSDSAYDVYNPIMEMYNNGDSIEKIREEIDLQEPDYSFSELELEIYTTAYALAMWEIGGITQEQIQKVRDIVNKGASSLWNDINPTAQKDRQKALIRFLQKIEQPNLKIKKRKTYKKVSDFIFALEDVFVIPLEDESFGAVVLIDIFQEGRVCYYAFAEIILRTKSKPTLEDVLQCKVHARINIGFDSIKIISHKKLLPLKDKFEKIGTIKIKKNNMRMGHIPPNVDSYEEFCSDWNWNGGKMKKKIRNLTELLE